MDPLKQFKQYFEDGTLITRPECFEGNKIFLEIKKPAIPYVYEKVDILFPRRHHARDLLYMYVGELIELLDEVKKEGIADKKVIAVFETLLLAMDYLTDKKFINSPFNREHLEYLRSILKECFDINKSHSFSTNPGRPRLYKGEIFSEGERTYTLDNRDKGPRVHMVIIYWKPDSRFEHFKHVGKWLGDLNIKQDNSETSFEDFLKGMTNHELHTDLLYELNLIRRTFSWFLNSYSCRENELALFDEIDIRSKLSL